MKRFLKYAGIAFGVLVAVFMIILGVVYLVTESHWNQTHELISEKIVVSDDPEIINQGKHVFTIRGCVDCHGENLQGGIFLENGTVGRFVATNLTSGSGGIGSSYSDEDLVRSIRHGIRKDGRSVLFMPSYEYNSINQKDMTALVSYIRSREPVDNILPESKIGLPIRAIYMLDKNLHLFPARVIDHTIPLPVDEPVTVLERGKYLADTCMGCHGAGFGGGKIPGVPPDWPEAANLTPGGQLADWTEADFFKAMREGITPDGRQLQAEYMPYPILGSMTDDELHALFVYLQSLESRPTGSR